MHLKTNAVHSIAQADRQIGISFAEAVNNLLFESKIDKSRIAAIGSHGQTIRHHPNLNPAYSMQIGDPNTIAALTGIRTVADFRRRDIAIGGQGAPLTPAFHAHWLQNYDEQLAVVNLGGFCNVTLLPKKRTNTIGFDTGPANALLDAWYRKKCPEKTDPFDRDSNWAQSGRCNRPWLKLLLENKYFSEPAPKSTGHEVFNLKCLEHELGQQIYKNPADTQATLVELTANSIAKHIPAHYKLVFCGGGAHNVYLCARILHAHGGQGSKSDAYGLACDWVEAVAFAWLAKQHLQGKPSNHPASTGALQECVLGGIYS